MPLRIRGGNRDVRESADDVARGAAKGEGDGGGREGGGGCGGRDCEAAHTGQGENDSVSWIQGYTCYKVNFATRAIFDLLVQLRKSVVHYSITFRANKHEVL